MDRLVPIDVDDIQSKVKEAISVYLANHGMENMSGSAAVGIMSMMQKAIDADDISVIISEVRERAIEYNKWLEKYWPDFEKQYVLEIDPNQK